MSYAGEVSALRLRVAELRAENAALTGEAHTYEDLLTTVKEERDAAREALAFYAEKENYRERPASIGNLPSAVGRDAGQRARAALASTVPSEEQPDVRQCASCGEPILAGWRLCQSCVPTGEQPGGGG